MNFRETLSGAVGDNPILITGDGKLKRTRGDYVEAHRAWFEQTDWTLTARPAGRIRAT